MVFSAPTMLRICPSGWANENIDDHNLLVEIITEGVKRLSEDANKRLKSSKFNIDVLFNAYTEKDVGNFIKDNGSFGFGKLYADSGGLQIVTAGMTIDDSLKSNIYATQSIADYAMCFDEIPCITVSSSGGKGNRAQTTNKLYIPSRKLETALKTANNIKEQIEILSGYNDKTNVHYIVQGNTYQDMVDWVIAGCGVLEKDHFDRIGGLALAGTCMGNGTLESVDMLVAYHNLNNILGPEKIKKHIHLLGFGSVSRLVPAIYLSRSGFINDDVTISFDSSSYSMSYYMGRFNDINGKLLTGPQGLKKIFHEVYQYFGDIYEKYIPNLNEEEFLIHVLSQSRSVADTLNNEPDGLRGLSRANIALSCLWQVLGFVEQLNKLIDYSEYDNTGLGRLQQITNMADYHNWLSEFGKYIPSKRIAREKSVDVCNFFQD